MSRAARRAVEVLAIAVSLVAGYLYLEELGRLWLFWLLAGSVAGAVMMWHGRRRLRALVRRLLR